MPNTKVRTTQRVLSTLNYSGLDRIYQQLDGELGFILTFHRVNDEPRPEFDPNGHLAIRPQFLRDILNLLKERGIEIVSFDEACKRIELGRSDGRFAVLTFDDGYRDTLDIAAPILREHNVPYTVFIATGLVDGTGHLWWETLGDIINVQDRLEWSVGAEKLELECHTAKQKQQAFDLLMSDLMTSVQEREREVVFEHLCDQLGASRLSKHDKGVVDWDGVLELASDELCTIGAHTVHHLAISRLTESDAEAEILQSLDVLESKTGTRPQFFSYPYGYRSAAGPRDFDLAARLQIQAAVTTRPGMIFPEHAKHMTALPRISVNGHYQNIRYFAPLISGLPTRLNAGLRKLDVA